jgi:hypothetical protein
MTEATIRCVQSVGWADFFGGMMGGAGFLVVVAIAAGVWSMRGLE